MHKLDTERWLLALGLVDRLADEAVAVIRGSAEAAAREHWAQFIDSQLALTPWIDRALAVEEAGSRNIPEARLSLSRRALDEAVTRLRRTDDPTAGSLGLFRGAQAPLRPLTLTEAVSIDDLPVAFGPVARFLLVVLLLKESRTVATEQLIRPSTRSLGDLVEYLPDFSPYWDDEESLQAGAAEAFVKDAETTLESGDRALLKLLSAALQDRDLPEAVYYTAGRAGVPPKAVLELLHMLRRRFKPKGPPAGHD